MTDKPTDQGGSVAPTDGSMPMVTCRVCDTEVPLGAYCGFCGASLSRQPGDGPDWLRVRAYSAAEGENVLRMALVSSLFPHLPHRSRTTFRWGLASVVLLLAVFAILRWQAPLVAVSAFGLPLLFLIYVEETDVYGDDDLPLRTMLLTTVVGAALGVGWALLTAPVIARSYSALIFGVTADRLLVDGLAIPVGGAVLMLVPAVVVRLMRPRNLESLDGFLIGSLGAIAFTAAGTMVRLAPQIAAGLTDRTRPVSVFLIEAGIQGVAVPLTAAAVGGMFGAALWYTWQGETRPQQRKRLIGAVVPAFVVVLAVYAVVGIVDVVVRRQELQLALHLLTAAAAVLALRVGLHLALLNETREEMAGEPILCAECNHVVPDMAFCPNCGVATRAASRTSRTERRLPATESDPVLESDEESTESS
jgi:hypothetical protein